MPNKIQTTGTVMLIKRMKNSITGNPRFYVIIGTDNGEVLRGNTASNNIYCYSMPNEGDKVDLSYHVTKAKGGIIFDDLTTIK